MSGGKFDGLLMGMAQECGAGGVPEMLDHLFGFLARKTDFYTGGEDPEAAFDTIKDKFGKHKEAAVKAHAEKKARMEEMERKAEERGEKGRKKMEEPGVTPAKEEGESKIIEVTDEEAKEFMNKKEEEKNFRLHTCLLYVQYCAVIDRFTLTLLVSVSIYRNFCVVL